MLSQAKLAEVFKSPPAETEGEAIQYITNAWVDFFSDASVAGIPAKRSLLEPARAAMTLALVGMSAPGVGAAKLTAAITAFWAAVTPSAASIWVTLPATVSATPPPTLASIALILPPIFAANTAGRKSINDAANDLASAVLSTQLGGATLNAAVPPLVVPIL